MIRHTSKGQLYYDIDYEVVENDRAVPPGPTETTNDAVFYPLDDMEFRYGRGTRLYFSFVKAITLWNAVLATIGVVGWAVAVSNEMSEVGAIFHQGQDLENMCGTRQNN